MPEVKTRGGYSHWNPDNPEMPYHIFMGTPRLFESRKKAKYSIIRWFYDQNGRRKGYISGPFGEDDDEEIKIKLDGRKKEDLEIVEIKLEIKNVPD